MSFRFSAQTSQKQGSAKSLKQLSDLGNKQASSASNGGRNSDSEVEKCGSRRLSGGGSDSVSFNPRNKRSLSARQVLEIDGGRPVNAPKQRSVQGIIGNQSSRSRLDSSRFLSENVSASHSIMHDYVADKLYRGRMDTTARNEDDIRAISVQLEAMLEQIVRTRQTSLTASGNNNNNLTSSNNSVKQHRVGSFRSSHSPDNPRSPINVLLGRISQRVAPEQFQELLPGGNTQELLPGGGNATVSHGARTAPPRHSVRRRPSLDVRPLTIRQISRPFLFGLSLKSNDDMKNNHANKEAGQDDDKAMSEPKQLVMYNAWLDFASPSWRSEEKRMEYLSFKRSDTNIILKIVVFVLLIIFGGTMVMVHYTKHTSSSVQAAFIISLVFALIAILSASFTIFMHFSLLSTWYDLKVPCISWLRTSPESMHASRLAQMAEDMVVFFIQLAASMFLLARSLTERELEKSICTAVELPPDLVCIAMSIVLLIQIFSKGSCKSCLVVSWITSIIFTNVSLYLINSSLYFWIDATYFFLLAISYELERQTLRHFIKSVMAVEIIEYNAELQLELANQVIHEGEQSLQAKRSIVRHVGHEIRTPLNTIAIGGDILAQELAAIHPPLPATTIEIVASIQEASANALETVNELLCFEKISAGMDTTTFDPISANTSSHTPSITLYPENSPTPTLAHPPAPPLTPTLAHSLAPLLTPTLAHFLHRNEDD